MGMTRTDEEEDSVNPVVGVRLELQGEVILNRLAVLPPEFKKGAKE